MIAQLFLTRRRWCTYKSLKDGSAKKISLRDSCSGDNYSEAVDYLQAHFDCPCLIHQTHVRMISEAPALKDGTSKELRPLHNTAQQHLHALKAMGHEPPGPFITSLLELMLDANTMFFSGSDTVKSRLIFVISPSYWDS